MITVRYFAPSPALAGLVSSYYCFDAPVPRIADVTRAELPQVRFLTRGTGSYRYGDGHVEHPSAAMLTGSTTAPIAFEAQGPLTAIGAGLMPAGWATLVGCSADQLSDRTVALESVAGEMATITLERLRGARSDVERGGILDALMLSMMARTHAAAVPLWFTRAVDSWLVATPSPSIDALVADTGVSARQVERLSNRLYGASPKLMARKYRALQAAVRIAARGQSWTDAAGDAFYDQSHFIHEFRTFVGTTPKRFAVETAPVNRLTIAGRQRLPGIPKLALYS